jgi:hypothetical protein
MKINLLRILTGKIGKNDKDENKNSHYEYTEAETWEAVREHEIMAEGNVNSEINWTYVKVFIFVVTPVFMALASFEIMAAVSLGFLISLYAFLSVQKKTLDFTEHEGKTDLKMALLPLAVITAGIIFGGLFKPFRFGG